MITIEELYKIFIKHPHITTDSRQCSQGAIFFALKGDNFNGNKFAKSALEKGCAYAVIDEPQEEQDDRYLLTTNVLETLQKLAQYHRDQLTIPIIGITGTNGKTTTKELIATVLKKNFNVQYTKGNFNNHIGVPISILSIDSTHDIAVIEMGANHPKEIEFLTKISKPTCGLITNVGKAHLEGFGSLEGVINTKKELYDWLISHKGTIFVNHNNEYLTPLVQGYDNVEYYSSNPESEDATTGEITKCNPYLHFKLKGIEGEISTHLIGSYNIDNILSAVAIGRKFGISDEKIVEAIAEYTPTNNRSQLMETERNTVIIDAYNANATSMKAAIENFNMIDTKAPKCAILGDMLELGEQSSIEHQRIITLLENSKIDNIILVGKEFGNTTHHYRWYETSELLAEKLKTDPIQREMILLKGSHGIGLQKLIELL